MRLALDHHYSTRIAVALQHRGHDVVAAVERGWHTLDDEALLDVCQGEGRALLTNNVRGFAVIARQRVAEGRSHAGLVFTSDEAMPRARGSIGRYAQALDRLMTTAPVNLALSDQIHWL